MSEKSRARHLESVGQVAPPPPPAYCTTCVKHLATSSLFWPDDSIMEAYSEQRERGCSREDFIDGLLRFARLLQSVGEHYDHLEALIDRSWGDGPPLSDNEAGQAAMWLVQKEHWEAEIRAERAIGG